MKIIECPHCCTRVVPLPDGDCPSCRADTTSSKPDLEVIGQRQILRNQRAQELVNQSRSLGCLTQLLGLIPIIGWFVVRPVSRAAREAEIAGRRLAMPDARLVLANTDQAPVVYLRSFSDDGTYRKPPVLIRLAMWAHGDIPDYRATYEEHLVSALQSVGPVVSIGRPGEPMPELGAYRMYVSNDHWQAEVLELLERSRLVVLRVGASQGLMWEVETVMDRVPPEQVILYCEPSQILSEELQDRIPVPKDTTFHRSRFVAFDSSWKPLFTRHITSVLRQKKLYQTPTRTIVITIVIVLMLCWIAWMFYNFKP